MLGSSSYKSYLKTDENLTLKETFVVDEKGVLSTLIDKFKRELIVRH